MNDQQTPHKDDALKVIRWVALGGFVVGFLNLGLLILLMGNRLEQLPFGAVFACTGAAEAAEFGADERRWNWDGGDTVDINLADVTVRYGDGISSELVATGSRQALAHIDVRDGKITSSCRNFPWGRVVLTLPATRFRHIGITGPGRVEMKAVEQPELEIEVIGPGSVHGDGRIAQLDVSITGPGTLKLAGVAMDGLDVRVIGPIDLEAGPKNKARIHVIGPGMLRLLSHPPELDTNIIGPANITYASDN